MANKNLFQQILAKTPSRSTFDLTHDIKLSAQMGPLYPIMVMDCIPGDTVNIGTETMVRFAPLIAPVMHRFDVSCHYFFVPNRLTWENWEQFITGNALQGPGGPGVDPTPPFLTFGSGNTQVDSLANYLGVPVLNGANTVDVNALPFAAYQMIYNEFYRDQNLIPEVDFNLVDGSNAATAAILRALRGRAWSHDYFTSALPWAQKGSAVDIPIAPFGDVPVKVQPVVDYPSGLTFETDATGSDPFAPVGTPAWQDIANQSSLYADTSTLNALPTTINDLRTAFRLQEWLEKNARSGTRYVESILAHFGVRSSDKRLQRPEYICGLKSPIVISEVLNTTGETAGLPQGNMAGHGVGYVQNKAGKYFCEEHGYIIGVMSILPTTAYQQGVPKHLLRNDRLDYAWPVFANLGEQEITQIEVFADQPAIDQAAVFGYTPRYSEYKYMPNRVAGDFQDTLSYWHAGRIFNSPPTLSKQFVEADPTTRIFAVTAPADNLYCQVVNHVKASRPLPFFGTPTF